MKYSKELHELVRKIKDGYIDTGTNEFSVSKVSFALLDEIERLQAELDNYKTPSCIVPLSELLPPPDAS